MKQGLCKYTYIIFLTFRLSRYNIYGLRGLKSISPLETIMCDNRESFNH